MIISIRRAEKRDIPAMARVVCDSWRAAYSGLITERDLAKHTDVSFRAEIYQKSYQKRSDWEFYVVLVDGEVQGVCAAIPYNHEGFYKTAEIMQLYISPDFFGIGLGRKLLSYTLRAQRAVGFTNVVLYVLEGNRRAVNFYERFGFCADGTYLELEAFEKRNKAYRYRIEL